MGICFRNEKDEITLTMPSTNINLIREIFGAVVLDIPYSEFNQHRSIYYLEFKNHPLHFFFKKKNSKGNFSKKQSEIIINFFDDNKIFIHQKIGLTNEEDLIFKPFIDYLREYKDHKMTYQ